MKFLVILLVVLIGVWLWRSNRHAETKNKPPPPATAPEPLDMVRCSLCSVHLPVVDAVQGEKGVYCSAEHRHRAEH